MEELYLTLDIGIKNKLKSALLKGNVDDINNMLTSRSAEIITHA